MNISNMIGGVYLDQLKLKHAPKKQQKINIQFKHKKVDGDGDHGEENEKQIEEVEEAEKPHKINFVDKRQDVNVNRDLVLQRLNKHSNIRVVERKEKMYDKNGELIQDREYQIPMVAPEKSMPIIEKMGIELERPVFAEPEELAPPIIEPVEKPNAEAPKKKKLIIKGVEAKKTEEIAAEKPEEVEEIKEEEKEEAKEPEKPEKKKRTRKVYEKPDFGDGEINEKVKIGNKLLINRLPKKEKFVVKTSDYYLNNRKLFIQKISELFKPYKKELIESAETVSCKSNSNVDFKLLTHQKVIMDYLNLYTPYRGCLIYHNLGSGKTCTGIAVAEGMKSSKPIILMTPASLKTNFFAELKKCGDLMYRKNQYWEFISTTGNPDYVPLLSKVLKIPEEKIVRNKGAWLVDVTKKESNFDKLESSKQKQIDEQLDMMIRAKYLDINYNGITKNAFKELTENYTKNPFDNATVIIDEAHNFVSRIVNQVKIKSSLSYRMYDFLMKASNTKIVLLTGTPIINYPNELGILYNILRGYIKQWTFQLSLKKDAPSDVKLTRDSIVKLFEKENFKTYDYIEFTGNKLLITRNPYGFINTYKKKTKGGASETEGGLLKNLFGFDLNGGSNSNDGKKKTMKDKSEIINKNKTKKNLKPAPYKVLKNGAIKIHTLEESPSEPDEIIFYDDRVESQMSGGDALDDYNGITLDETGNISDADFEKEIIRILNKNHIEIVKAGNQVDMFKPLPDDESFIELFVDHLGRGLQNVEAFKKRILGLTSYFRSSLESLTPSFIKTETGENYHIVPAEMSAYQFATYQVIRDDEIEMEKSRNKKKIKQTDPNAEELYKISGSYRTFSRAACNFAFPNPPGRPTPPRKFTGVEVSKKEEQEEELDEQAIDAVEEQGEFLDEEKIVKHDESNEYAKRINEALKFLAYKPDASDEETFLTKEKLPYYSPKFAKILENIQNKENVGLHLLYSQFRTLEGIGILKLVLEANGFAEFKIKKNSTTGLWEIAQNEDDTGKPKFVLYTGTETAEEKEIIRNIYNSNWEIVPSSLTQQLREISSNNHYGEIIKVLMITSSGAEGINLKNTRFVHIVEPYWHMVRVEQVIGRARRFCSHQDLPEELRNVKVFLYLTVFSEEQKTSKKNIDLMLHDSSYITGKPITTDENLLEIALRKTKINNQLLNAVKETAIDCSLYNAKNKDENLVCFGFGKVSSNMFASFPRLEQDLAEKENINIKKITLKLRQTKPIDGVVYIIDPATMDIYDDESYQLAREGRGELIKIGKIVKKGDRYVVEKI